MKSPLIWIPIGAACFALSCASNYHQADRGVEGTLRSTITDRHVHVDVDRGVVKLEGKVNTEADRERIEMLARRTAGVVAVKNNLKVALPSPGDYGAIPSSTAVRTAPPTAVVTAPPLVTQGPAVVIPAPAEPLPPAIIIPDTPRVKVQPAASSDQVTANRIADQLSHDPVATGELDNVTITVNGGTAAVKGIVDSESKHDELLTSVHRAGGINTIYDQLQIK